MQYGEDTKVVYNYDDQKAMINYIDETTGQQLGSDSVTGRNNAKIEYTTVGKINELTNKGYVLVNDGFPTDAIFDNDKNVDQIFEVILKHGRLEENGETKTIKQTINYVYGNGPLKGGQVAQIYEKDYVFTSRNTLDAVTKEVLATTWSTAQMTEAVASPTVAGYVADKATVSATQLDHNSANLKDTINYYVGEQLVTIHYIDVNGAKTKNTGYTPSDGKEITDFIQHLSGEAGTKYSNRLQDYGAKGYELVYAQPEASEGMFDEDTNKQQDYYVYLEHGTKTATGVPVTITDTINYVYGNGPHKGEPAFPPSVVEKVFTPTYVIDKVTGETIETVWNGDGTIDPSVVPALDGYTPDKLVVAGRVLTPDMKNQSQTVYYYVASELDIPETPSTPTTVGEGEESSQKVQVNQRQVPSEGSNQVLDQNQIVNREVVGELPQTGDENDEESMLLGLGLLSGAALLGATELGQRKRRKRN